MPEQSAYHIPVMFSETMDALDVKPDGIYIDGTLGGGGHSAGILERLRGGMLYGIDKDAQAIAASHARLGARANFEAIRGDFHDIAGIMAERGVSLADGILLDLGVSSRQLDAAERGFSYHNDAPLDMRMDQTRGETAADLVNTLSAAELARVFFGYGEERWSARVADTIVKRRAKAPVATTLDLVACVDAAIPAAVRRKDSGHPARRVFQALRIAVNDELEPLPRALEDAVRLLKPGGRLCVITFHSLEDRIVKQTFARLRNPCTCPPSFPVCVCGLTPSLTKRFTHALPPGADESARNPRAASAKLRIGEKI